MRFYEISLNECIVITNRLNEWMNAYMNKYVSVSVAIVRHHSGFIHKHKTMKMKRDQEVKRPTSNLVGREKINTRNFFNNW